MNKLRKILTACFAVAVVAVSSSSAFAQTPPDNQLDGFAAQPVPTLSGVASSLGVEPGNLANELVSYTGTFFITMLFLAFAISIGWVILRQFKRAAKQS